ncbi:MAG: hypothetical protein PHX83_14660 [Acidobacteriia bacterium]|nr:hypothetical protein [Terriglobia bacterium]
MGERLETLLAQTAGFTLLDLLDGMGINVDERHAMVRGVWVALEGLNELGEGICERLQACDVLNDDQVVVVMGLLLRELIASIGHLHPVDFRLTHLTEIRPVAEPGLLIKNRLELGV